MRLLRILTAVLVLALGVAGHARAVSITVPIDSQTNADLRTYTNGSHYPVAPTTLTVGGIPFALVPLDAVPHSLGIIQTPLGNSAFTIPTNINSPTTVYTLMNSAFGTLGANNGAVEFIGAGGAFASFDLIQGNNIRDHFNGSFNNVVTDPTVVTVDFGGDVRLDRQTFVLPSAFASDTLTQIRFVGTNAGNPQGQTFLAAVTVGTPSAAVPEPSTMVLLASGLGAMAVFCRRSRRSP